MSHNDKRDLIHQCTVLMNALAYIEEVDADSYHTEEKAL